MDSNEKLPKKVWIPMQNGEKKVWNSDVLHRGRFIIFWNSPLQHEDIEKITVFFKMLHEEQE